MLYNPWSAVGNPTSALGPSGSSFGPSSLAPLGIHHLLLSNLTTDNCPAQMLSKGGRGKRVLRQNKAMDKLQSETKV